ncbi:MAG: argininosuccinate lyase [Planctomycetes bacterium]|nr:argininosuccinate lyase [Planctomycetota bacterium]
MVRFCTGNDPELDAVLIPFDVAGSIAHVRMLGRLRLLTAREVARLRRELTAIRALHEAGRFSIRPEDEDVHTAIERRLTERLGDTGRRVHTGRSRNDQVLTALRLYGRETLLDVTEAALALGASAARFAARHARTPMPGYTHTRRAMPSSFGFWAGAFAEAIVDDVAGLRAAWDLLDQSPLGAAAGFGTLLPLDRAFTARLLGFSRVQRNAQHVQNSRGKIEAAVLAACTQPLATAHRMAVDLIWYSTPEFGFVRLPDRFCTGSSLMPNKRNPDVLELIRAACPAVCADEFRIKSLLAGLPSGYNRDLQLTKEPFLRGLRSSRDALAIAARVLDGVEVDAARARAACTPEIFATDAALEAARQGVPFRSAYRAAAATLASLAASDPAANIARKRHVGAPGNLDLRTTRAALGAQGRWVRSTRARIARAMRNL